MAKVKIFTSIKNTKNTGNECIRTIVLSTEDLAFMCRETDCPLTVGFCPFGESIDCQDVTERDWLNLIGAKDEQDAN